MFQFACVTNVMKHAPAVFHTTMWMVDSFGGADMP